jgi:hypothetical protein
MFQVFQTLFVCTFVNSPTCEVDDYPEQPQSPQNQPPWLPQRQMKQWTFHDSSGALYSMYLAMAKEKDDEMTGHWKEVATDGVLIFVSHHVHHLCCYAHKSERYRPVYFLLLSPRCSPCLSRTSGRIPRTPPHSISGTFIRSSPIQTSQHHAHPSLQPLLYHPRSLRRDMPSG